MEHLAELLKLVFEKGRWLAGLAVVAIALAVARYMGMFADVDPNTVFLVYLVGAISGAVSLIGGVVAGIEYVKKRWKDRNEARELRRRALKNLPTLPTEYQTALMWMAVNDEQRISEQGDTSILDTLAAQGYLGKEDPEGHNVIKTYVVTDEIWAELKSLDLSEIKGRISSKRPWRA